MNSSLLTPWAFHDADQYFRIRHNIAVAVVVSLLVHGLLLLVTISPRKQGVSAETRQGPLEVRLAEAAPPSPAETIAPPPDHGAYRPPAPHRDPPRVVKTPVQSAPPVDTPSVPTRQPDFTAQPDMMAMIHARRRGIEAAAARENAQARASDREPSINEAAAASITRNLQTLSQSRDGTSGVFQILRKGVRTAQFSFRGWTTDTSNQWRQVYEVDAGVRGNIELAIVRKMIELIRTHYQGNFNWDSHRLGRVVVLSARLDDNAGLEDFLMREFFGV